MKTATILSLFLYFSIMGPSALAMSCQEHLGAISIESAIAGIHAVSGRLGFNYLLPLKRLANRIVVDDLKMNEGIPIEYYNALVAISQLDPRPASLPAFGLNREMVPPNPQSSESSKAKIPFGIMDQLYEIKEVLSRAPEKLNALAATTRVFEFGKFQYVTTQQFIEFDLERHSTRHERNDQAPAGFVIAPHKNFRNEDYVAAGAHLIGRETIIKIYSPEGVNWVTGEMLGTINNNWEVFVIRESATGDIILVHARRDGGRGLENGHLYLPKSGLTVEQFKSQNKDVKVVKAGDYATFANVGRDGAAQTFWLQYPTHVEVVNGVGRIHVVENGDRYMFRLETETGSVYYTKFSNLLYYTMP